MNTTAYDMISTTTLMNNWMAWGIVSGYSMVVYMDSPETVTSIEATKSTITVTTSADVYEIPTGEKDSKMWRILA
jgi:hypothetical protein